MEAAFFKKLKQQSTSGQEVSQQSVSNQQKKTAPRKHSPCKRDFGRDSGWLIPDNITVENTLPISFAEVQAEAHLFPSSTMVNLDSLHSKLRLPTFLNCLEIW